MTSPNITTQVPQAHGTHYTKNDKLEQYHLTSQSVLVNCDSEANPVEGNQVTVNCDECNVIWLRKQCNPCSERPKAPDFLSWLSVLPNSVLYPTGVTIFTLTYHFPKSIQS